MSTGNLLAVRGDDFSDSRCGASVEIIEGDALAVMQGMPSESVPLIITSPPYNILNSVGNGLKNGGGGNWPNAALAGGYGLHTDNMPRAEYVNWQRSCLTEMLRLIPEDGAIFYNVKERVQEGLRETPESIVAGFPVRQRITWKRAGSNNHNAGAFLPNAEIIYFIAKHKFRVSKEGRAYGVVWEFPQERNNCHPAPFPIELPLRCIRSSNARTVLDPFAGSGTTGLACILEGRNFVGIEIEPRFVQQSFDRMLPEFLRSNGIRDFLQNEVHK